MPSARVAFAGDFVESAAEVVTEGGGARAGTVEGAALSGLRLAEQLERVLSDSKLWRAVLRWAVDRAAPQVASYAKCAEARSRMGNSTHKTATICLSVCVSTTVQ